MRPLDKDTQAWMDDHLDAYIDEELTMKEAKLIDAITAADKTWDDELAFGRELKYELRGLPELECPPELTQAVFAETRRLSRAEGWARIRGWVRNDWFRAWQPALAMSLLLAVVVSAALWTRPAPKSEVDIALEEVQWTLAYLSSVGAKTGASVRADVLEPHVVTQMQQALGTVMEEQTN